MLEHQLDGDQEAFDLGVLERTELFLVSYRFTDENVVDVDVERALAVLIGERLDNHLELLDDAILRDLSNQLLEFAHRCVAVGRDTFIELCAPWG